MASLDHGALFALSRYRIVRLIATGGMGAVYEVVHLETERRRALKVLHPQVLTGEDRLERFKREARIAGSIESEFIVDVFDAGIDEPTGMPYLVMELLRGEDLGQRLERLGRLAPAEVIEVLRQTALALEKTHKARVIHRDLKPRNIFLAEREDGPPHVKVLDFGIAKIAAQEVSSTATQVLGTLLYMAWSRVDGDARRSPRRWTSTRGRHEPGLHAAGRIALLRGREGARRAGAGGGDRARGPRCSASARAAARGVALPEAFDAWFARATAASAPGAFHLRAGGGARRWPRCSGAAAALSTPPPARPARPPAPAPRHSHAAAASALVGLGVAVPR